MEKTLSVCDTCECPATRDNGLTWLSCGHVFCDRHYPSVDEKCNKCGAIKAIVCYRGIMKNIYQAVYECKQMTPTGLPGYINVRLGLPMGNGSTDITIQGTLARFVVGKEYLVNVYDLSER